MTANAEPSAEGIRSRAEILHRFLLCGHNGEEAHVEIFLPPHKRPIRAAKRHIGEFAFKENGECGELLFRCRIEQVHIAREPCIAKTAAGCKGGKQARIIRKAEAARRFRAAFLRSACFHRKRNRALRRRAVQAACRRIGEGDCLNK